MYLILTGRRYRRKRLCNLFWDLPDDPRASLRWSLSRLRSLVDEPGCERINNSGDVELILSAMVQSDLGFRQ